MNDLKSALEAYKAMRDTERALEPLGVEIGNSKFAPLVYDYLAESIAEYSPYYSYYRWHPIGELFKNDTAFDPEWFVEYIYEILNHMDDVDKAAEEISNGMGELLIDELDSGTKRMVCQVASVTENMLVTEKLLDREEDINPISDKARTLAGIMANDKTFVSLNERYLEKLLGEEKFIPVRKYLRRETRRFKSALK